MKKHIIFDFDDTVCSSYEHNQQLFVDTFLPYKSEIDEEFVRLVHYKNRGRPMKLQFKRVIDKYKLKADVQELVEKNEILHGESADKMIIFNGFGETIKHLKRIGKIVSLCTNRDKTSLEIVLKNNHLLNYFDEVVSCKDEGHEKPDPFCLNKLIRKHAEIKRSEIVYFGDSETDAEFASNAGIDYLIIDHYLNKKQFYNLIINSFVRGEDELFVEVAEITNT